MLQEQQTLGFNMNVSDWVFSLGLGVMVWSSQKQDIIAFSTMEAEYVAAIYAACQVIKLSRFLCDVGLVHDDTTQTFCNNKLNNIYCQEF